MKNLDNNLNNQNDNTLELTKRILDDGTIVDLKSASKKNQISTKDQILIGSDHKNMDDMHEVNDLDTYEAYIQYRQDNKNLNLKSKLNKVNTPEVNSDVSVFSHDNDLVSQSILLSVILLIKPLFAMDVNLKLDNQEIENNSTIIQIKSYIQSIIEKIKIEAISRYMNNRTKKVDSKNPKVDVKIVSNIVPFSEILVNLLLIWLKNTYSNPVNTAENQEKSDSESKLSDYLSSFIDKTLEQVFTRIKF